MGRGKGRWTIQARVIALSVLFTVIVAVVVLLSSVYSSARQVHENELQSAEYQLKTAAMAVRRRVDEIDELADWCAVNAYLRTWLLSNVKNGSLRNDVYTKTESKYNAAGIMPYIQRLLLASTNGKLLSLGTAVSQSRPISLDAVQRLPGLDGAPGAARWETVVDDPLMQPMVHMRGIPVSGTIRGEHNTAYIYLSVSTGLITDVIRDLLLEEGSRLYWYMGGRAYRCDGGQLVPLDAGPASLRPSEEGSNLLGGDTLVFSAENEEGRPCSVVACPLGAHGLYLAESVPVRSPLEQLPTLAEPIVFILAAILLLGVILSVLLRAVVGKPIKALQRQIEQIGAGNFTTDPAIEWDHELGDVGRGINRLSENVTALMERRLEDEKQKQDLEFRMLQGQINPHFLYNTLSSIRWMAAIQHADGIVEMVTALSRLLKSVSKSTEKLIPLRGELALLNDYFTIQRYRYGGTITMETVCEAEDEVLDTCRIPRFTLQPLAENAIFHGIEPKGCAGRLVLTIRRDGDGLLVSLADDGAGMTPEQIEAALASSAGGEKEAHVGLRNVHKRLRYSFGSGLHVESVPGEGTTVSFRLPEGEEGVKA